MYNGIGLQTPRGSGTNGYIQTNKFFVKPRPGGAAVAHPSGIPRPGKDDADAAIRKANKDILDHDSKRRIQLRLVVLEEALVDQGYTASEIAERLAHAKQVYEAESAASVSASDGAGGGGGGGVERESAIDNKRFSDAQTHQVALRKEKQSEIFRSALKITQDRPSEPECQQQKSKEKISDSGSEDSAFEERQEQERVSKDSCKQFGRDFHALVDQDREKNQGKRAPAEEPSTKDIRRSKTEVGGKMDDTEKSKHDRSRRGKTREYSDSSSDCSRRKGGKARVGHGKDSQVDTCEEDSGILSGKKRRYVNRRKKSNRKYYSGSSDSEGDSGREQANRETKRRAKLRRRHDSASDSERYTREDNQAGKYKKSRRHDSDLDSERYSRVETRAGSHKQRQRHDSEDSESDMEGKNNELLKIKQIGKQKSSRRRDSESSESDTDIERMSRDLKGIRKPQIHKRKGPRHDSEDSLSDAIVEKKRKGNLVENRTEHRASKDTEDSDNKIGGDKNSKSRIAKRGKSESRTSEESGNDSFDSDRCTDSDSSTDYSHDGHSRSQRREDGARKADTKVVKVQRRPDLEEHVSSFKSSGRDDVERDDHKKKEDGRMNGGELEVSRSAERKKKLVSKGGLEDDDHLGNETRRKRMRDDDELDKLPNVRRNMGFEMCEDRKRKESRGEGTSGHMDYSRSMEDRKEREYSTSNKLEGKGEYKVGPKDGTGSRNSDRDFQGDDVPKRRRVGDHSQRRREEIHEHSHADGDRHKSNLSRHRREERYEHNHGVYPHYDHRNSDLFRHQRKERCKSSRDGEPSRDRFKYHHSGRRREEGHERSHDDSGHYDGRGGR